MIPLYKSLKKVISSLRVQALLKTPSIAPQTPTLHLQVRVSLWTLFPFCDLRFLVKLPNTIKKEALWVTADPRRRPALIRLDFFQLSRWREGALPAAGRCCFVFQTLGSKKLVILSPQPYSPLTIHVFYVCF